MDTVSSLVVVPLAPEETPSLTLAEWDLLVSCERVLFERPDHPLIARLTSAGVAAGPFDDEPDPTRAGWALVADPRSPRVVELAQGGAAVTSGPARAPDDLTAAQGAPIVRRSAAALGTLALVMARLRGPGGCPWDAQQTHESLRVHLLEEAHEVLEAIDAGAFGEELEEELGDLLLQMTLHTEIAEEAGEFTYGDVFEHITAKLLRRHPHVFGDAVVTSADDQWRNWQQIKRQEKGDKESILAGVSTTMPALAYAQAVQERAARVGFDWPRLDDVLD
nr:MazG family protein [Actinomycetota bacterium]